MSDHDLELELLNQLKDLAVGQAAIGTDVAAMKEHLVKLNGKVATHELKVGEMQIELAERRNQCPLVDLLEARTRTVEDYVTAEKASAKTSSTWLKWLWPVIWAAAGALALLILLHSTDLLKFKL
jgi:hypothetical protein